MKIGFYCSGKATRITKLLISASKLKQFNDFLEKIGFIYIDHLSELYLDDICKELHINLVREDVRKKVILKAGQVVSERLRELMDRYLCDYLFVFGSQVLKKPLITEYKYRIINFHPSLLPAFPGLRAIDKAIGYGSFVSGNTAHFIDEGIDTGPIIMQNFCSIEPWEGYDKILDRQIPMVLQISAWLESDRIKITGRKVRVLGASYAFSEYVPNLELDFHGMRIRGDELFW